MSDSKEPAGIGSQFRSGSNQGSAGCRHAAFFQPARTICVTDDLHCKSWALNKAHPRDPQGRHCHRVSATSRPLWPFFAAATSIRYGKESEHESPRPGGSISRVHHFRIAGWVTRPDRGPAVLRRGAMPASVSLLGIFSSDPRPRAKMHDSHESRREGDLCRVVWCCRVM